MLCVGIKAQSTSDFAELRRGLCPPPPMLARSALGKQIAYRVRSVTAKVGITRKRHRTYELVTRNPRARLDEDHEKLRPHEYDKKRRKQGQRTDQDMQHTQ